MKLTKSKKVLASIVLFIVLVCLVLAAAYKIVSNTVQNIIMQNIDELAEHDMQSIQVYIANAWGNMESLKIELDSFDVDTIDEVMEALNVKVNAGRFERAYLIDDEGRLYSNTFGIFEKEDNDFLPYFDEGKERFVYRYDDKSKYHEIQKEYLIYGIDFSDAPLEIGGVKFVHMAALNDLGKIQDKIKITCFNEKGYSSIINKNGYYIISIDKSSSLNQYTNFYDLMEKGKIYGISGADEVKRKILNNESFWFYYRNEDGAKKYISIKPMDNTVWFFVNAVESSVFYANTFQFALITMGVVAALIVILCVLMYVNFSAQRKLKKLYNSVIDGVYNRHYYDEKLSGEAIKALAMIDLDKLKSINDTYGHIAGDYAIESVGNVLRENLSAVGDVVRYGGDEFAVAVKEDIPAHEFKAKLEKVLDDIRNVKLEKFPDINLTLSIGGYYCEGKTEELFKEADALLYEAKINRNNVVTNV